MGSNVLPKYRSFSFASDKHQNVPLITRSKGAEQYGNGSSGDSIVTLLCFSAHHGSARFERITRITQCSYERFKSSPDPPRRIGQAAKSSVFLTDNRRFESDMRYQGTLG